MKKLLFLLLIALMGLNLACEEFPLGGDFLEKPPSVDVTIDTVFSRTELAERFLWGAYTTLPYGIPVTWGDRSMLNMDMLASLTDINHSFMLWGGANRVYYSGQYTAESENGGAETKHRYNNSLTWRGIRDGYIFLENADRVPDMDPDKRRRLKAEAKMIIALHYAEMYRHYGGLPWVDRAYSPNDDTFLPRSTAKETLENIIGLIDEAAADLPWQLEDVANWEGRFTRAGALALKCRMLLFAASPLFNDDQPYLAGQAADERLTWFGGYDAGLWQRTVDASEQFLNEWQANGGFALVKTGNPREDFRRAYYERGNGELLISTRWRYRAPSYWSHQYYFFQSAGNYGTGNTTLNYVNMFPMANGLPIDDPSSGYNPDSPYVDRDPRLYETVLVNGDSYQGRKAELYIGGRERPNINANRAVSGHTVRKFLLDKNESTNSIVQWPYLRLPEIFLTYAEALNEVNGGPTADAYNYVNLVRDRVNVGPIPTGLSQEAFREAVLRERVLEFGYENVRWYDLIRWKREQDFTKPLEGIDLFLEDDTLRFETKTLPNRYWQENWSPKWYLSAFPVNEINKGSGLIQNPGW